MEKTTLYLSDALQRELRAAAKRTGRSQAELVREALRAYLRMLGRPELTSIGAGRDTELTAKDAGAWLRREWRNR